MIIDDHEISKAGRKLAHDSILVLENLLDKISDTHILIYGQNDLDSTKKYVENSIEIGVASHGKPIHRVKFDKTWYFFFGSKEEIMHRIKLGYDLIKSAEVVNG